MLRSGKRDFRRSPLPLMEVMVSSRTVGCSRIAYIFAGFCFVWLLWRKLLFCKPVILSFRKEIIFLKVVGNYCHGLCGYSSLSVFLGFSVLEPDSWTGCKEYIMLPLCFRYGVPNYCNMTKRKITADDLAAILSDSDSSEMNFVNSVEDVDWDPLLLSDERNYEDDRNDAAEDESDSEDEERDAAEEAETILAMDDSVVAAPVTNDSIEDEEMPSENCDVSIIINNGCWTDFVGRQHPFSFSGQGGLLKPVSPDCSPLDVFSLPVDENIIRHIVAETNRYATQTLANRSLPKFAWINKWVETDQKDRKNVFGLILWMGLVRLKSIENIGKKLHSFGKMFLVRSCLATASSYF